ncbi:MAG: hypothetical protein IPO27_12925 [Bacteroidetes bacterium]|nr:hypothetical protein [Bacteroidota bacterium]
MSKYIITAIVLTTIISSCKKDEDKCTASKGGSLTIVAFPQHHSKPIFNKTNYLDTIYVKFNSKESPGLSPANYDTYFVGEAGEDHVHMEGLKCGDYFFLGAGFDTTINARVVGGIPYSTDQKEGEININIPVTE